MLRRKKWMANFFFQMQKNHPLFIVKNGLSNDFAYTFNVQPIKIWKSYKLSKMIVKTSEKGKFMQNTFVIVIFDYFLGWVITCRITKQINIL